MVWEPFAIAVVFGLVVSAGLYFIVMWPQVEPDDDFDAAPAGAEVPPAAAEVPPAAAPPLVVDTAPVDTAPVDTSTVETIPVATITDDDPPASQAAGAKRTEP